MRIREFTTDVWLSCQNEHGNSQSKFKLHAALPISHYSANHGRIYQLLKKAVNDGIIYGFKVLNMGDSQQLQKILGENKTIQDDPKARIFNNPFTIYLYDQFDPELIADFCRQLESALMDIPPSNRKHLSEADLELTEHLTFRQETLDGKYVAIAEAPPNLLARLRDEGNQSNEYKALRENVAATNKSQSAKEKERKAENIEKEKHIHWFYNTQLRYFRDKLASQDINKQFQAACAILNIDPSLLNNKASKEQWLQVIKGHFNRVGLRYHPDKISNPKLDSTRARSTEIFKLIVNARAVLTEIAEHRAMLDKANILAEDVSLPKYQYELQTGFSDDPYVYIKMARNTKLFTLVENWEFVNESKEVVSNESQISTAVQIYEPQLRVYHDQRKIINLPGHEAFYRLFMANALPRGFKQGHLAMILEDYDSKPGLQWLLRKCLTTPEFINFLGTNDLISLAISATRLGLVNIGLNSTDIFIFYYRNYPETFYDERIKKFMESKGFDFEKAVDVIIAEPHNFNLFVTTLGFDFLIEKSHRLRQALLARENHAMQPSRYAKLLEFEPAFSNLESEENNLRYTVIKQLLQGDTSFLSFLSDNELTNMNSFIIATKNNVPARLCEYINRELERRKRSVAAIHDVRPIEHFKKRFLSGHHQVVNFLNKEALMLLAAEPEIDWSDYLPIAQALLQSGEKKSAFRYLNVMAEGLGINISGMLTEQALEVISGHASRLAQRSRVLRDEIIEELKQTYLRILSGESNLDLDIIHSRLELYGKRNITESILKTYSETLEQQFYLLVDRLKAGEKSPDLLEKFNQFRIAAIRAGIGWDLAIRTGIAWYLFSGNDREGNSLLGSQIPRLLSNSIRVYTLSEKIMRIKDKEELLRRNSTEREKSYSTFGINMDDPTLDVLPQIFYLYRCFGAEKDFYSDLQSCTCKDPSGQLDQLSHYDEARIVSHLVKFLDNELAVYVKGGRDSAEYKINQYVDNQNICEYPDLYSLYHRIGQMVHLQNILPNALQQLYDADKKFNARHNNIRPLNKYIEMRRFSKITHPLLEHMAFQQQMRLVLERRFNHLKQEAFWNRENNRTVAFRNDVLGLPTHTADSDEQIVANTQSMLKRVADFLADYSDSPLYNTLLNDFRSDPIIADYLGLAGLGEKQVATKATALALITAIRSGVTSPVLNRLELVQAASSSEPRQEQPRETQSKEKTFAASSSTSGAKMFASNPEHLAKVLQFQKTFAELNISFIESISSLYKKPYDVFRTLRRMLNEEPLTKNNVESVLTIINQISDDILAATPLDIKEYTKILSQTRPSENISLAQCEERLSAFQKWTGSKMETLVPPKPGASSQVTRAQKK